MSYSSKKDNTTLRFKPSKLKPEVEVSRNDKLFNVLEPNVAEDFDLPWNSFEWGDKKRKYGKRALYRTARFKNRYVDLIDIDERMRNNRRELVYTVCDQDKVMRVPAKFLQDFCL
jgi:hypothetical protein